MTNEIDKRKFAHIIKIAASNVPRTSLYKFMSLF